MPLQLRPHAQPLPSFAGCRLVWPCVAIGGVAQLAADLLLETLQLRLLADVSCDGLLPFVAYASPAHDAPLLTAIQLYYSEPLKLVVVQQRADVSKEHREAFRGAVLEWCRQQAFAQILFLTGCDAAHRRDAQLEGVQLRIVGRSENAASAAMVAAANRAQIPLLEPREPTAASPDGLLIPSGGMARPIFVEAAAQNLPVAVLLMFVSEGDNLPFAADFATGVALTLEFMDAVKAKSSDGWQPPLTWQILQNSGVRVGFY